VLTSIQMAINAGADSIECPDLRQRATLFDLLTFNEDAWSLGSLPERGSKRRSALINVTLIGAWAEARAENIAPITRPHPIFSAVRLREELFIS
jgi:hypothetical protein